MRDLRELDKWRRRSPEVTKWFGGGYNERIAGVFDVEGICCDRIRRNGDLWTPTIKVMAATGDGWDHVSASLPHRCPTWGEMDALFRLFFREGETAVQFHVPRKQHVNCHEFCLHIWRPLDASIAAPPIELV